MNNDYSEDNIQETRWEKIRYFLVQKLIGLALIAIGVISVKVDGSLFPFMVLVVLLGTAVVLTKERVINM